MYLFVIIKKKQLLIRQNYIDSKSVLNKNFHL